MYSTSTENLNFNLRCNFNTIRSSTKLTLDLLLPNGSSYTVNDILYQHYHLLWRGDRLGLVILNKSDSVQHLYRHLRRNIRAIKIPLQIDNLFFSCIQFRNAFSRTLQKPTCRICIRVFWSSQTYPRGELRWSFFYFQSILYIKGRKCNRYLHAREESLSLL